MRMILAATALLCVFASSGAEARAYHHHYHHAHFSRHAHYGRHHHYASRHSHYGYRQARYEYGQDQDSGSHVAYSSGEHVSGGRPRAWCGWYMRGQVAGDPGPTYNLARSWAHYGANAGGPRVGAIVVWSHHVGKIVGEENGQWIVQSGNDGHAVRTRPRSLAGAIAFRTAYASY
jgi:hypothetical protein